MNNTDPSPTIPPPPNEGDVSSAAVPPSVSIEPIQQEQKEEDTREAEQEVVETVKPVKKQEGSTKMVHKKRGITVADIKPFIIPLIAIVFIAVIFAVKFSDAGNLPIEKQAVVSLSVPTAPGQETGEEAGDESVSGAQVVELSVKNGNYFPQEIRVKKDIPVEIVADMNSVKGCLTTVLIPEFGVRKTLTKQDNKITFTPTKTGRFPFHCSMRMGTGTIVVEE